VKVDCVSALRSLVPDTLPEALGGHPLPSLEHCVGVHRLLGEDYGLAISEALEVEDGSFTHRLTVLCSLMRAYVVLDDYLRDHGMTLGESSEIQRFLTRIARESQRLIRRLEGKDTSLWECYMDRYREGNESFASHPPFLAVREKCSFVFLPFEISAIQADTRATGLKELVATYLFALQLMDDFHDVDEDRQNAVNQNLFLLQTDPARWNELSENRGALAPLAIGYVSAELGGVPTAHVGSVFRKYVHGSQRWLHDIAVELPAVSPLAQKAVFPDGFSRFSLRFSELKGVEQKDIDQAVVESIRAENMHSACHDQW